MKHVIIGCGPAGIAAAETIRSLSEGDEIVIISDEARPLYSRCLISYALRLSGEFDISYRAESFFDKLCILPLLGRRAAGISPQERTVRLDDGRDISFDRLLIATGGSPEIPDVPGADMGGVLGFRNTADLAAIISLLPSTRAASVLGGGCVGLQVAEGLMARGIGVTIIVKSPRLLSRVADETAGEIYARLFSLNGAKIVTGADVRSIDGGSRVEFITLDTGMKIECQLVVFGKGVNPNMEVARDAGIRCESGIIVDRRMMTGVSGIYAAGDVAQTIDAATEERAVNALWPCASEQGRVAGSNMAGSKKEYDGSLRMNAVEFFGLPMISAGRLTGSYESYSFRDEDRNCYRKLLFNRDILVGFIMVGETGNAGVMTSLVRKRVPLGGVKDELIAGRLGFSRIVDAIRKNRDKFSEESYGETLFTLR